MVRETESGSEKLLAIGDARGIEFCPSGDCLAISCWKDPVRLSGISRRDSLASRRARDTRAGPTALTFSPDGQTLATCGEDRTIILWDCRSSRQIFCLFGHTSEVTCLAFSPCGRILASGGHDRTVRLWDVASQREIATLRGHSGVVRHIAFSPDGLTLATCTDPIGTDFELFLWPATPKE